MKALLSAMGQAYTDWRRRRELRAVVRLLAGA